VNKSDIFRIKPSVLNQLRSEVDEGYDTSLAYSIKQRGLLQPIIVRSCKNDGYFEIVAGNRRYKACRSLGYRKIASHVVELDDKAAFEVALIENIQRKTLDPIEEGQAFKHYVSDYGYGGISELADKLCKSVSYIAKRIKLLELPVDILDSITSSMINTSTAEELLALKDKSKQSELAQLICDRHLSLKKVRDLIKEDNGDANGNDSINFVDPFRHARQMTRIEKAERSFDKTIIALRIALSKIGDIVEGIEDDWIVYEALMHHKNQLHCQIDILIKEKRRRLPR
jgi:ParB family chromosome partitioning protein